MNQRIFEWWFTKRLESGKPIMYTTMEMGEGAMAASLAKQKPLPPPTRYDRPEVV